MMLYAFVLLWRGRHRKWKHLKGEGSKRTEATSQDIPANRCMGSSKSIELRRVLSFSAMVFSFFFIRKFNMILFLDLFPFI